MSIGAQKWDAVQLHANDHVATALRDIKQGEHVAIQFNGTLTELQAAEDIPLCHKIALADIQAGRHLKKYGEVIGEASTDIARGAHVHVHNINSLRARRTS